MIHDGVKIICDDIFVFYLIFFAWMMHLVPFLGGPIIQRSFVSFCFFFFLLRDQNGQQVAFVF